jgi:Tannase and feruloyl esterase
LIPGMAHSSQGRASTVSGKNDTVPLPRLPGNNNQTPSRDQDQMFSALLDWVEKGNAPSDMLVTSRDSMVSYPICVYPKKIKWDGVGASNVATSYSCR